ncbi:MAG TPA: hypothetical protein PKH07_07010 [bacterium]|nr:hypothetical protein [bacterium]
MATNTSHSHIVSVGQVFTPITWAEWLLLRWGVFDAWITGASVCDPTAGEGVFALALFRLARARGIAVKPEMLVKLTLIEVQPTRLEAFRVKASGDFGIEFPNSNLFAQDIITEPHPCKYDILVGNPPWANFTDLPPSYKEQLKPFFVAEGLVPDKKRVLLGSSRTDIAALVLKVVLGRLLGEEGFGCFYLPSSLFFGDDAHIGFRDYTANHRFFSVDEVCEFTLSRVFDGVGTSYCCARFQMDVQQSFPVRYFRESSGDWIEHSAMPLKRPDDQWRVLEHGDNSCFDGPLGIELDATQKPRQGVNTCGANSVFIFDRKPSHLPSEYLYPLATKEVWREGNGEPHKWILLPYDAKTGRPLPWSKIEEITELRDYLNGNRGLLQSRKGTLIQSAISKGLWWSLLGVGPYSFAPYKVIWEAYGQKQFRPIRLHEFSGHVWQANQAMHAFIPCWSEKDAKRIQEGLLNPDILSLLRQLNGDGKCNWAQPGKIQKILAYETPQSHQPLLCAERREECRTRGSSVRRVPRRR